MRKILATIKKKIKKCLLIITGVSKDFNVEVNVRHKWFGNDYGGFYVSTEKLNSKSVVYSFGIGEDVSFDLDINRYCNCKVNMFDPTPKSINWVKKQSLNADFMFFEYGISNETLDVIFYLPVDPKHVSGSMLVQNNVDGGAAVVVHVKSIKEICDQLGHDRIDVLKMDIEGAEYDVIKSLFESKIYVDQILVEFHSRFFNDGFERTKQALEMFKKNGYKIFAVSDTFEEVSFIKC